MNDNERTVYSVPVRLYIECTLFVLATSPTHARKVVEIVDLQDYFGFTPTTVHTDDPKLLRIDDVVTFSIDTSVVDLTALTIEEYPPNTHPDFIGVIR